MIPETGPNLETGSPFAERKIYQLLKDKLSNDFIVIHSIPWLSEAAKKIDGRAAPTGEIDFLILHPELGVLALEVKGGAIMYDRTHFVYLLNGAKFDPLRQVRSGTHGLARWLGSQHKQFVKIGYALVFPASEIKGRPLPPALSEKIIIDIKDLAFLGEKIKDVLNYWKTNLDTKPLGAGKINELADLICPFADYSPSWQGRIEFDNQTWLKLTDEQYSFSQKINEKQRAVVTGYPGTGKTLLGISLARKLASEGKKVLFLVHNTLLADFLNNQLSDSANSSVFTFHQLCSRVAAKIGKPIPKNNFGEISQEWFDLQATQNLEIAVKANKLDSYDALIIDEGQVFHNEWLKILAAWFNDKKITVFCDETQVFEFEKKSSTVNEIVEIIGSSKYMTLTINQRSPRAVSERLQQVKEPAYQLQSRTAFESDTLEEIAVEDPDSELKKVLKQLQAENVPPQDVIILFDKMPPEPNVTTDYPVRIENTARFRGLESPIVIVYAPIKTNENHLFCAYSRATTRCIVIYDAFNTTKQLYGTFGKTLLESKQRLEIERAASVGYTVNILKNLNLSKQTVISKIGRIEWCSQWSAWLITNKNDDVTSSLLLDYLCVSSKEPVFHVDMEMREHLEFYECGLLLSDVKGRNLVILHRCAKCGNETPHKREGFKIGKCILCEKSLPKAGNFSPVQEIEKLAQYENILSLPRNFSTEEKLSLPVSLLALGSWNALDLQNGKDLSLTIARASASFAYRAALVFTGVHIVKSKKGDSIELKKLSDKYYESYKNLNQISSLQWKSYVSLALELWKTRGIIAKQGKGKFCKV